MDKKIKQLKARIITMNGSNERYMGKRKYSQMKIMRVELEKIRVMDIRKLGNIQNHCKLTTILKLLI